jgi:diaminohydroxyphosphoribosylaminopyrimidine deaminase / 5-amino-6-(5-phosphoribosylamino)uracil reductase
MPSALEPNPAGWGIEHALQGLNELAAQAVGLSDPNPRVACRLLLASGQVFEGHTQQAGGPHAEVVALRAAQAAGADVRGATALVTLEPCSHHGRTPPCCDALMAAGVARVVVAQTDPNPLVNGQGVARLRAAGVAVEVLPVTHPLAVATRELNIGFFSRMERGLPWVRLKVAASIDGTTALHNGTSQWITGREARADGHAWRKRAGALLTGVGTVLADDPRLDVRLVDTARQPLRVVVDSRLDMPATARILQAPGEVLVYTALPTGAGGALAHTGAVLVNLPEAGRDKVDLPAVLRDLAQRGVNELHVEAGHKLNGSFLRAGLVDELLVYLAPKLMGTGAGLAALGPFTQMDQALNWRFVETGRVGDDLRLRMRRVAPTPST